MAQVWERRGGMPTLEERTSTVADFAMQLRREGPANFLYADGDVVFLHGDRRKENAEAPPEWPGLHFLVQHSNDGQPFSGAGGVKVKDVDHPVLLVA